MMNTYIAYYGTIGAQEQDGLMLASFGISLAPYDHDLGVFRARVPESALQQLNAFPADFRHALSYRSFELETVEIEAMTLSQLKAEVEFCRFMASADEHPVIQPATWKSREGLARQCLTEMLPNTSALLRLAAEGQVTVTREMPDDLQSSDLLTLRAFYDRNIHLHNADRSMVIETQIRSSAVKSFFGESTGSNIHSALLRGTPEISLMGNEISLDGRFFERIARGEWSQRLAGNEPALELLSIQAALGLAKNHLLDPDFRVEVGIAPEGLLGVAEVVKKLDGLLLLSTVGHYSITGAATALADAKRLLDCSDDANSRWLSARLGHLLDAPAPPRQVDLDELTCG